MAKENRSAGASVKTAKDTASKKAEADSRQADGRSDGIWVNERGEVCIGTKCFSLRVKTDTNEVRVKIDRNECGTDLQPLIDEVYQALGKGAPTVYETVSEVDKKES
ncbi:hypothetical protein ES705_46624 [subsurface metagenome]